MQLEEIYENQIRLSDEQKELDVKIQTVSNLFISLLLRLNVVISNYEVLNKQLHNDKIQELEKVNVKLIDLQQEYSNIITLPKSKYTPKIRERADIFG